MLNVDEPLTGVLYLEADAEPDTPKVDRKELFARLEAADVHMAKNSSNDKLLEAVGKL